MNTFGVENATTAKDNPVVLKTVVSPRTKVSELSDPQAKMDSVISPVKLQLLSKWYFRKRLVGQVISCTKI